MEVLELIDTVDDVRYDLNQPSKNSILFMVALKHLFGRQNILEIPHRCMSHISESV